MRRFLNRRQVSRAAVLAAASTLALTWVGFDTKEAAVSEEAFVLLRTHLGITQRDRAVVRAFTRSLLTTSVHDQAAAGIAAMWRDPARREARDRYILQEFFVSTNYLSVASGQHVELAMLPVDHRGLRVRRPDGSRILC